MTGNMRLYFSISIIMCASFFCVIVCARGGVRDTIVTGDVRVIVCAGGSRVITCVWVAAPVILRSRVAK